MIKRKQHKKIKTITATGMTLFSLLASFTAVIAWFSLNNSVSGTGMAVKAKEDGLSFSSLTVHRCIKNTSTSEVLQFYETPAFTYGDSDPTTSLNLPYYSQLHTSEPILLLFTLNEHTSADSIVLDAKTSATSMQTEITSANHSQFPLSSAVFFKTKAYSVSSFSFTNVVVDDLTTKSFVTMSNGTSAGFTNNISLYSSISSTEITYVAVVMDYYAEALEYIFSHNLGTSYDLAFSCDFVLSI